MKIVKASAEILSIQNLDLIELAGRTCYKSEDRIGPDTAPKFVVSLIARGHESVIEHASMTVRFIVDRGVSHEIVRHRIASHSQESTRYCNYSKGKFSGGLTFVEPCFWASETANHTRWYHAMRAAETAYLTLLASGASPQEARSVLPNSLKTEVIMTANFRSWRNFFRLRTATAAHPQMREVAVPLLAAAADWAPAIFGDL